MKAKLFPDTIKAENQLNLIFVIFFAHKNVLVVTTELGRRAGQI
jgi:hypothetical protein